MIGAGWQRRSWALRIVAIWSVLLFTAVVVAVALSPEVLRFRGDTLGIDISARVGRTAAVWSRWGAFVEWRPRRDRISPSAELWAWNARNSRWLAILVTALPLQFLLLRTGSVESLADQVGVIITIAQWFLVGQVFRVYPME